jgi:hypothetical protein
MVLIKSFQLLTVVSTKTTILWDVHTTTVWHTAYNRISRVRQIIVRIYFLTYSRINVLSISYDPFFHRNFATLKCDIKLRNQFCSQQWEVVYKVIYPPVHSTLRHQSDRSGDSVLLWSLRVILCTSHPSVLATQWMGSHEISGYISLQNYLMSPCVCYFQCSVWNYPGISVVCIL